MRTGLILADRWRDLPASTAAGKPVLLPPGGRCRPAVRYLARVRDPFAPPRSEHGKRGGYRSRCFSTAAEARTWGMAEQQRIQGGAGGGARIGGIAVAYLDALRHRVGAPVSARHLAQVAQVARLLERVADDPADPAFARRVERWLAELPARRSLQEQARPASEGHRRKFLAISRALLRFAVARRMIGHHPLDGVRLAIPAEAGAGRTVFRVDDLRRLVADPVDEPWAIATALMIYTGLRLSEALALTWAMVETDAHIIRLPAEHPGNKMRRERRCRLQPELAALLAGVPGRRRPTTAVVGSDLASAVPANLAAGFQRFCRRRGVEPAGRGPHGLRHTFGGLMTALGESSFLVMDAAGHRSVAVAKRYSAAADELRDQVATWPRTVPPRFWLREAVPTGDGGKPGKTSGS